MTWPIIQAVLLVGVLAAAWYGGRAVEAFTSSPYCAGFTKRVTYAFFAVSIFRGAFEVIRGVCR